MRRPVESLAVSITFTAWRRRMVTITPWRMGAIVPLQRAPPAAVRSVFVVRRAARTAAERANQGGPAVLSAIAPSLARRGRDDAPRP